MSDGSHLKELEITSFPQFTDWPKNAPKASPMIYPLHSPDGTKLLYTAEDGGLYNVDAATGQAVFLFSPASQHTAESSYGIGTYCWSADGKAVRFLVTGRENYKWQPLAGYVIDSDGHNLRRLFVSDLKGAAGRGCSIDGQQSIVRVQGTDELEKWGLYVINLDTGEWKQILSYFNVDLIRRPQNAVSPY